MKFFNAFTLLIASQVALVACDGRKSTRNDEATFRVDSVSLDKETVQLDAMGLPSLKTFQFKACLVDEAAKSAIALTEFIVSDGKNKLKATTENDGCLLWNEKHKVSALQKERMLKIQRTFIGSEGFEGEVKVELAFNPWVDGGKLVDLRKFKPSEVEENVQELSFDTTGGEIGKSAAASQGEPTNGKDQNAGGSPAPLGAESAQAFLSDVKLDFRGHKKSATEITRLLKLKPVQTFLLRMQPQFIKRSALNQTVRLGVKGGEFRIKILVLREDAPAQFTLSDLAATVETDVSVLYDGTVTQEVALKVHDTSLIMSRNKVLVIVEPRGEASQFARSGVYTGIVGPLLGKSVSFDLLPATQDNIQAQNIAIQVLQEAQQKSPTGYELLEKVSGLVRDDQGPLVNLITDQKAKDLLGDYCAQIYPTDLETEIEVSSWFGFSKKKQMAKVVDECKKSPEQYLNVSLQNFVEEILGQSTHVPEMLIDDKEIAVSQTLSYSKSKGQTYGSEFAVKGGVSASGGVSAAVGFPKEAPLPLPLGFKGSGSIAAGATVAIGKDWYYTSSYSTAESAQNAVNVSQGQKLTVVGDGYEIPVAYRTCAVLQPALKAAKVKAGFFACGTAIEQKTVREQYYLINHNRGASAFADDESAASTRWRITVRGTEHYKNIERLLNPQGQAGLALILKSVFVSPNLDQALLPDFRITQGYPGALSRPESP